MGDVGPLVQRGLEWLGTRDVDSLVPGGSEWVYLAPGEKIKNALRLQMLIAL